MTMHIYSFDFRSIDMDLYVYTYIADTVCLCPPPLLPSVFSRPCDCLNRSLATSAQSKSIGSATETDRGIQLIDLER